MWGGWSHELRLVGFLSETQSGYDVSGLLWANKSTRLSPGSHGSTQVNTALCIQKRCWIEECDRASQEDDILSPTRSA